MSVSSRLLLHSLHVIERRWVSDVRHVSIVNRATGQIFIWARCGINKIRTTAHAGATPLSGHLPTRRTLVIYLVVRLLIVRRSSRIHESMDRRKSLRLNV